MLRGTRPGIVRNLLDDAAAGPAALPAGPARADWAADCGEPGPRQPIVPERRPAAKNETSTSPVAWRRPMIARHRVRVSSSSDAADKNLADFCRTSQGIVTIVRSSTMGRIRPRMRIAVSLDRRMGGAADGFIGFFSVGLAAAMVRQVVSNGRDQPAPGRESGRVWAVERWLVRRLLGARRQPADRAGALERRSDRPRRSQGPGENPRPPHVLAASGQRRT